jgi:hypothetical protein
MELYELDRYGFSRFERIPLTQLVEKAYGILTEENPIKFPKLF